MPAPPEPALLAGPGESTDRLAAAPAQTPASHRRPALDGIRAVAVVAVMVYHFGASGDSWLPGGFLGVDVFFVLSGYLITGLLLREHSRTGRIKLVSFWVRRAKRLAPALIVMLIVVCAWIWWAAPPGDYARRREDVFWTLGYLANWHLAGTDIYFAAFGSVSPLRHAWSLAVEEQFYLLWPAAVLVVLWLGGRLARVSRDWPVQITGRRLLAAVTLAGVALSAVFFATLYDPASPSVAYYSTRGRVQELFAGALLALGFALWRARCARLDASAVRRPGPLTALVGALAVTGLLALLCAFVWLPDSSPHYYRGGALLVSLAAVALIAGVESRPDGTLARGLSWRPAVWLGRISYGVYLWHWPVVLAIPITGDAAEHVLRQAARLALTLALAVASFYLVEQPVQRSRRLFGTGPRVVLAMGLAAGLVVTTAFQATALPGPIFRQLKISTDRGCSGESVTNLKYCVWPEGEGSAGSADPPEVAVLGDSTARALYTGMDDWAKAHDTTWIQAAWKQCSPAGIMIAPGRDVGSVNTIARTCVDQVPGLVEEVLDTYRPKVVLISEFWIHHHSIVQDGKLLAPGTPEHDAALRAGLVKVVDKVAGHGGRVVMVELPPPGEQLGTIFGRGRPAENAQPPVNENGRFVPGYNDVLRSVAQARPGSATTINVDDVACPGGECPAAIGDLLIRWDGIHYSQAFSAELVPVILRRAGVDSGSRP